jgi:hypothetical protein
VIGPAGPQGPIGSAGPQGPAGANGATGAPGTATIGNYFAGRIRGIDGFVASGSNFTATRTDTGKYTLVFPAVNGGHFLMTVVTPTFIPGGAPGTDTALLVWRVTQTSRNGLSPFETTVLIEMRDWWTGNLVDSDFDFITMERS